MKDVRIDRDGVEWTEDDIVQAPAGDKNPPEFYGIDYLKKRCAGAGGGTRWEDNGAYFGAAQFVRDRMRERGCRNVLDVGCGRGWVVKHLRGHGLRARGCEYGTEAVEHSVCGAEWADLTDRLPYANNEFDFVLCVGVLSQIPESGVATALAELARVCGSTLWTNILVRPDRFQQYHRTVEPPDWWMPRFEAAGLRRLDEFDVLIEAAFQPGEEQWGNLWTPT